MMDACVHTCTHVGMARTHTCMLTHMVIPCSSTCSCHIIETVKNFEKQRALTFHYYSFSRIVYVDMISKICNMFQLLCSFVNKSKFFVGKPQELIVITDYAGSDNSNLVYQPLLSPILFMLYSNYVLKTCSTIHNKEGIYYQWMTKLLTSKKPSSLTYSVFLK